MEGPALTLARATLRETLEALSLHPESPIASFFFVVALFVLLLHLTTKSPHTDDIEYAAVFTLIAAFAGAVCAGTAQVIEGGTHRDWMSVVYAGAAVPALWVCGNGLKHSVLIPALAGVAAYAGHALWRMTLVIAGST